MWVKLDDSMPDDPAVDGLSDGSFRLYVAGICYAQKHLTDGYVEGTRARRLTPNYRPTHAAELVAAGLWESRPDGWQIRNFAKWNRTRDYWRARQERAARRKEEWKARQERNAS